MLLQRLSEYADRLRLPPQLYSEASVRYIVELDWAGNPLSARPTDTADPGTPRTKRGQRRVVPQVQRTMGIKPLLLADSSEYTLGLPRGDSKPQRAAACHQAYLELLERCAQDTREPAVQAVVAFLKNQPLVKLSLPDDFDRGATLTFTVDGAFPTELPSVQAFWAAEHDPSTKGAPVMQCLVCGQRRPIVDRLQGKLKGVPGGQVAGTSIISANANAFESYGLEKSLIAPTCGECGERFTKAANALLAGEDSRFVLGGAAFIFWTREPVEFSLRDFFTNPSAEQVGDLLTSLRAGREPDKIEDVAFYAASLSGSGGRTVVRDWIDTTIGDIKSCLGQWFVRQRIVGAYGEAPNPLGLYALAAATVRDVGKDLAPPTPRALLRAALTRTPLPWSLLYAAILRNRAEQSVTRQRAALIKLVLASRRLFSEEEAMVRLDRENVNPGYRCGRLLAVLEQAQRLAVPGAKSTIVDRFYGTASSAPAGVFARLLRGVQPHLSKLERDRPGAYLALERRLEEIQGGLTTYPRTLTLEEQGLFALGYYHQRASDRAEAVAAIERRKAQVLSSTAGQVDVALGDEELLDNGFEVAREEN